MWHNGNSTSSEELNTFFPNSAKQAYFLLLSPEASEAFYSCLYQGFNAYGMASSAKGKDGREGQKKSEDKKKKKKTLEPLTENITVRLDELDNSDECSDEETVLSSLNTLPQL